MGDILVAPTQCAEYTRILTVYARLRQAAASCLAAAEAKISADKYKQIDR